MKNNEMKQTRETEKTLLSVKRNGFNNYYDIGEISLEELRKHFMKNKYPFEGASELSEAEFAWMEQSDKVSLSVTVDVDNDMVKIYETNGIPEEERTDRNTYIKGMGLPEFISPIKQAESIIDSLESSRTVFNNDERNFIVNYAYRLRDMEGTRKLAECIYYNHGNWKAALAKVEARAKIDSVSVTIDNAECFKVDEWKNGNDTYILGNCIDDGNFFYADVNVSVQFEYDHKPDREEVEEDYLNYIAERDIDRHEAEAYACPEGGYYMAIVPKEDEIEEQMVKTNMSNIPVEDYREMEAEKCGFDSYEDFYKAGCRLGNNLDKEPTYLQKQETKINISNMGQMKLIV